MLYASTAEGAVSCLYSCTAVPCTVLGAAPTTESTVQPYSCTDRHRTDSYSYACARWQQAGTLVTAARAGTGVSLTTALISSSVSALGPSARPSSLQLHSLIPAAVLTVPAPAPQTANAYSCTVLSSPHGREHGANNARHKTAGAQVRRTRHSTPAAILHAILYDRLYTAVTAVVMRKTIQFLPPHPKWCKCSRSSNATGAPPRKRPTPPQRHVPPHIECTCAGALTACCRPLGLRLGMLLLAAIPDLFSPSILPLVSEALEVCRSDLQGCRPFDVCGKLVQSDVVVGRRPRALQIRMCRLWLLLCWRREPRIVDRHRHRHLNDPWHGCMRRHWDWGCSWHWHCS